MISTQFWKRPLLLALAVSLLVSAVDAAEPTAAGIRFFETKIRPALVKHCYECHSADSDEIGGGLLVDTSEAIRTGGESGHAVVPGDVKASLIIDALRHDTFEMPPEQKLADEIVDDFVRWIRMGAPDPRDGAMPEVTERPKADLLWSLQPIVDPRPPRPKNTSWPTTDIDRFIAARLEREGISPVADADRVTLLRRLFIDLTGLPPTPDDVEAFLEDSSDGAFADMVDRLLESPRFGERWGRYWLDVVRYAESNGKDRDVLFPHAWRYRDYVIRSFNEDKPYDRFLVEQLAGDLLDASSPEHRNQLDIATGFLALTSKSFGGGEKFLMDLADDQIDVTSRAMLGLTVACARCHDHKFDPIPTKDYYSLAGIFRSTDTRYGAGPNGKVPGNDPLKNLLAIGGNAEQVVQEHREHEKLIADLTKQQNSLAKKITQLTKKDNPAAKTQLAAARAELTKVKNRLATAKKRKLPDLQFAMGVREAKKIVDLNVLIRGEVGKRGEAAPRGFLSAISIGNDYPIDDKQSGRLSLARWIVDPENPLTSRVAVNRIWQHLFGTGLVRTVDNFGTQGESPSHPELLDYLARRFVQNGWSTKQLIREIVLSRTYQLSSRIPATVARTSEADSHATDPQAIDPDNRLCWRQNQRRLDVEVLHDAMLQASGYLDLEAPPHGSIVAEIGEGEVGRNMDTKPIEREFSHRAVYLPILRSSLPEILKTFDFAEPSIVVGSRATTTIPAQALFFMNSEFALRQAEGTARRLPSANASDLHKPLVRAFELCLARRPNETELMAGQEFVTSFAKRVDGDQAERELAAWTALCQALFATGEFRYLD